MSTEFNREKFEWLRAINFELSAVDAKVALALAHYFNDKNGGCAFPSIETLAADTGLAKGTVLSAIARIKRAEFLILKPGKRGRGHPNHYWMDSAKVRRILQALKEAKAAKKRSVAGDLLLGAEKVQLTSGKGSIDDAKRSVAAELTPLDSIKTLEEKNWNSRKGSKQGNGLSVEARRRVRAIAGTEEYLTACETTAVSGDPDHLLTLEHDRLTKIANNGHLPAAVTDRARLLLTMPRPNFGGSPPC